MKFGQKLWASASHVPFILPTKTPGNPDTGAQAAQAAPFSLAITKTHIFHGILIYIYPNHPNPWSVWERVCSWQFLVCLVCVSHVSVKEGHCEKKTKWTAQWRSLRSQTLQITFLGKTVFDNGWWWVILYIHLSLPLSLSLHCYKFIYFNFVI